MTDGPHRELEEQMMEQFGDLFGQLLGQAPGPRSSRDQKAPLRVSFAEAVDGGAREVELQRWLQCESCRGAGVPEDAVWETCEGCDGRGKAKVLVDAYGENTRHVRHWGSDCETCLGRGLRSEERCDACSGEGGTIRLEKITVQIPGGVRDGSELRIAGKGNDLGGDDGAGSHYLVISVGSHPRLSRRGDDLLATVTLDSDLAEAGGELRVPVPRGHVTVRVRPGTKTGDTAHLPGQGAQKLGAPSTPRPTGELDPFRSLDPSAHRGDLVVTYVRSGETLPEVSPRAVLGVAEDVDAAEIEAAYGKLVMADHPDRNPGDEAAKKRFDEASVAYAVLTSQEDTGSIVGRVPLRLVVAIAAAMVAYVLLTH